MMAFQKTFQAERWEEPSGCKKWVSEREACLSEPWGPVEGHSQGGEVQPVPFLYKKKDEIRKETSTAYSPLPPKKMRVYKKKKEKENTLISW